MSENENKKLIRRYYDEVLGAGKLEVLDEIARPDHVEHSPMPGQSQGIEGLRQRVRFVKGVFDPKFTVEHVIAEGDKVAVMWSNHGTHRVEFFGVSATGRTVDTTGIDIHVIRDGRMAEHWDVVDMLGVLIQIGAIPAPAGA